MLYFYTVIVSKLKMFFEHRKEDQILLDNNESNNVFIDYRCQENERRIEEESLEMAGKEKSCIKAQFHLTQ